MIESGRIGKNFPLAIAWLTVGVFVLVGAWLIPVNLKSLTPAVLEQAGRKTPSVARYGKQLLDSEKLGPAELVLSAARLVSDPAAGSLDRGIHDTATRRPEWVAWGGWDPFLDPLFNLKENSGRNESTPVLTFFITEKARKNLRTFLSNSRSLGVQAVLQTREVSTSQFVPASHPGGQALDSVILLTALLYQGEHLSGPLQRELRSLAESAVQQKQMGELETFYVDLLSLGKRLNWIQLCELLRTTDSTKTVGEFAHLSRVAADNLPLIYTAALFSDSADRVATYLIRYGKTGLEDIRLALSHGQGAVRLLLIHQVPLNRTTGPALGVAAEMGFLYPKLTLAAKYLGFLIGAFCLFRGLESATVAPEASEAPLRMKSSVLAVLTASLLILATEPFLLKSTPLSEFRLRFAFPALVNLTDAKPPTAPASPLVMETSTIVSIAIFAAFQVCMYLVCLVKIREISRQVVPPLVKLRLMENEENLFDGGLYIGIAGTAAALVLQVLRVIEPNLLAAYSSNLFGITCVALVKIRHVRAFKRQLILESQNAPVATAPTVAPTRTAPATPVVRASNPT